MPDCTTCGCPSICLATIDDHITLKGECREITGCTAERFVYGRLLSEVPDYWRIKK